MTTIAVDVGQSGLRMACIGAGSRRRLERPGAAVWLVDESTAKSVAASLAAAVNEFAGDDERGGPGRSFLVGLSGFDLGGRLASELARDLGHRTRARTVIVASDVVAWHLAAVPDGVGIVTVLGTGSITLAADGAGSCHRVDGWGHLIGDEASGFAVGRAGLASALRAHDGRLGSPSLLRRAVARYGSVERLVAAVNGATDPAPEIAGFAPEVVASAREGDSNAIEILDIVGRRLGEAIMAAHNVVFASERTVPVRLVGGLVAAADGILGGTRAALCGFRAALDPVAVALDPLDGVSRLHAGVVSAYPGLAVTWAAT